MLADSSVQVYQRECNWVQALEGDIDTCHTVFLHLGRVDAGDGDARHLGSLRARAIARRGTRWPTWTSASCTAPTGRLRPSTDYWRIANFLFPFYAMVPTRRAGARGSRARLGAHGRRAHAGDLHRPRSPQRHPHRGPSGRAAAGDAAEHHRLVRPLPLRREPGQRLPDRSGGAEDGRATRASTASSCKTRRSPRAWGRSTTARTSASAAATR